MEATSDTVHGRIERTRLAVTEPQITAGFLFIGAGITCH